MINTQPPEKGIYHPKGSLDVHSVFATIQGEGPFAGRPAVFVRLAGCNLQCPGCDTEYTATRIPMTVLEVANNIAICIAKNFGGLVAPLIVITGGEPFRQNIFPLVNALTGEGLLVQVETNGTIWPKQLADIATLGNPLFQIVCSPKAPRIAHGMVPNAYKYVLEAGHIDPIDGLPTSVLENGLRPYRPHFTDTVWKMMLAKGRVYVQPMDAKDAIKTSNNIGAAIDSAMRYGYTLCLQMHKYANLP